MSKTWPPGNQLLANLPENHYQRLAPHLQPVGFGLKHVFYEPQVPMEYVYFPEQGVVSVITLMDNGDAIETGMIGNEGIIGASILLGIDTVPYQCLGQVPGWALRMKAHVLKEEASRDSPLRRRLLLFQASLTVQVMQAAACNGLHSVQQRCCRWLLMCHDRAQSDEIPLTHEFLAGMLGVRRASVTDVLRPLQETGLIRHNRGKIIIVDRERLELHSCKCYGIIAEELKRL